MAAKSNILAVHHAARERWRRYITVIPTMMGRDELKISLDIYSSQLEEVVTTLLAGLIAVADARGQTVDWCREQARDRLREVDRIATNEDVRRTLFFTTELACHLARMNAAKSS